MKPQYLIIGDGNVARHFEHYFTLLRIPSVSWSRKQNEPQELKELFEKSDVVLVLISDSEIEPFLKENIYLTKKPTVHFSGRLVTDLAIGMHPLNTFPPGRYGLDVYERTPFICEKGTLSFREVFPRLTNPHFEIDREKKSLYHAMCVMSGNFTTILWEKAFSVFKEKLELPREALIPFLETTMRNLVRPHDHSQLTGPLARKDIETINAHLEALKDDPFKEIYEAFNDTLNSGSKK